METSKKAVQKIETSIDEMESVLKWLELTQEDLPSYVNELRSTDIDNLVSLFYPYQQLLNNYMSLAGDIQVTGEDDKEGMKQARNLRLAMRRVRLEREAARKSEKEFILIAGRAVEYFGKKDLILVERTESDLEFLEKTAERAKIERVQAVIKERTEKVLIADPNAITPPGIELMTDKEFASHLVEVAKKKAEADELAAFRAAELAKQQAEREAMEKELQELRAQVGKGANADNSTPADSGVRIAYAIESCEDGLCKMIVTNIDTLSTAKDIAGNIPGLNIRVLKITTEVVYTKE